MNGKKPSLKANFIALIILIALLVPILTWAFSSKTNTKVFVTIVIIFIYAFAIKNLKLNKTKADKIIEQAIKDGTVAKAKRTGKIIWYHGDPTEQNYHLRQTRYKAKYEYIVNDRCYKIKAISYDYPEEEIEVYYKKANPKKAVIGRYDKVGSSFIMFMMIIPFAITIILLWLFGVIPY